MKDHYFTVLCCFFAKRQHELAMFTSSEYSKGILKLLFSLAKKWLKIIPHFFPLISSFLPSGIHLEEMEGSQSRMLTFTVYYYITKLVPSDLLTSKV